MSLKYIKSDYSVLLGNVQKKAFVNVKSVRDVKILKADIELVTGLQISYNTLRRLFGFLDRTAPSLTTLNTLARYLGFRSYGNYLNSKSNFDDWYFHQKLLHIQALGVITPENVELLNARLLNSRNVVSIATFIAFFVEREDINSLLVIFNGLVQDEINIGPIMQFATIVSQAFLRLPAEKAKDLYKEMLPLDAFRNMVPLMYIDYNNLNGLYGDVVFLIKGLKSNVSDIFFSSLITEYRLFYNGEGIQNKAIKLPKNSNVLNQTLMGRYYGYKVFANDGVDPNLVKEIKWQCKKINMSSFSLELFPALIIKNRIDIISSLIDLYYEDLFDTDGWNSQTTICMSLISVANLNIHEERLTLARRNLEIVELEKVEMSYYGYISLLYYFTATKISYFENNKKDNVSSLAVLSEFITLTGFNHFRTVSLPYVLNSPSSNK